MDASEAGSASDNRPEKMSPSNLLERLEFLGFSDNDRQQLQALQQGFSTIADEFFAEFYSRLNANPYVAGLLSGDGVVHRLMGLQREYFARLLAGPFDQSYVESRWRIGAAHERIGLEPVWYLTAYCLYTQICFPKFATQLGGSCPPALLSLLKIVFADMTLVLDTYFAAATDQLRQRNAELETALKMYFQAEMQLQHHTRLASHEIRGTLNALANASDELCEDLAGEVSPDVATIHTQMREKLWKLCGVVDEILHSSLQPGRPQSVELDSLLAEIARRTPLYASGRSITLIILPNTGVKLWGDSVALREAFANLIANAFKHHHRDSGTIEVAYRRHDDRHEITVSDDGPGIPESVQDRIFEPFMRGAGAQSSGRGLGLYFVKRIIEDHGGHIGVWSQPGVGTRFTVELPERGIPASDVES